MAKATTQSVADMIGVIVQQMTADLVALDQQISGVTDLLAHPGKSPDYYVELESGLAELQDRRGKIQAAIDALKTLLDDGYPIPLSFELSPPVKAELDGEVSDVQAGASVFHGPSSGQASTGTVTIGPFVDKE